MREKELITKMRQSQKEIERLKGEAEIAEREGKLERVAEIRYSEIPALEKTVKDSSQKFGELEKTNRLLKEEVGEDDIAEVVSRWTGIPTNRLLEEESRKLTRMEEELAKRVVGQRKAVEAISNAIRRARTGLNESSKPIGSFIFWVPRV